jgi:GR25 family glycosyltransferase involved in LPS biosynthesis
MQFVDKKHLIKNLPNHDTIILELGCGANKRHLNAIGIDPIDSHYFGGFVCASLATDIIRRKAFARSFSDPALVRYVDSIDGRRWSEEYVDSLTTPELRDLRRNAAAEGKLYLRPSAIACALTHRDRLLAAAENDDVILCEDDARLSSDFVDAWQSQSVRTMFRDCGGVVLGYYRASVPILTEIEPYATFGRFGIYRLVSEHVLSTVTYYCPPAIARDIRQLQLPIATSADSWKFFQKRIGFESIYLVHPSPVQLMPFASSIGYSTHWLARRNDLFSRMARQLRRRLLRPGDVVFDKISNSKDLRYQP